MNKVKEFLTEERKKKLIKKTPDIIAITGGFGVWLWFCVFFFTSPIFGGFPYGILFIFFSLLAIGAIIKDW